MWAWYYILCRIKRYYVALKAGILRCFFDIFQGAVGLTILEAEKEKYNQIQILCLLMKIKLCMILL